MRRLKTSSCNHTYCAFGLEIKSEFAIPELSCSAIRGIQQIEIKWGQVEANTECKIGPFLRYNISPAEAYLEWDKVGKFLVRNGREIIVNPAVGVESKIVRLPLLGMVIALLLIQRGFLVLHGCAMSMNSKAVGFLGDKGAGKSTLGAALHRRGYALMADDLLVLDVSRKNGPMMVLPAFPQFKLSPEAAKGALGMDAEDRPRLHPQFDKRALPVSTGFAKRPLAISHLYVLGTSKSISLEACSPQQAIIALIRNSFLSRFAEGTDRHSEVSQMLKFAEILKSTSVYRLTHPFCMSALAELVETIEMHCRHT